MKSASLVMLGLLLTTATFAQDPPKTNDAPGVSVSGANWRKDVFVPALYEDPMTPNQEQADLKREQKEIKKVSNERVRGGQSPLPVLTKEVMAQGKEMPEGPSVNYLYQAKLKNTGTKEIRSTIWEYLVFDTDNQTEIGRHRFVDNTRIRPGKSANLVGYSSTPATTIIHATKAGKDSRDQNSEQVVITRIEYEDGTFWQRPVQP
jgi:hypothetical protein